MILIYCKKTSPRIDYIFNHILKISLNNNFTITNSKSDFLHYSGAKFSYANTPISSELFFQSNGLLEERGLENHQLKIFEWDNLKCFFRVGPKSALPFDIFSASFFCCRDMKNTSHTRGISLVNLITLKAQHTRKIFQRFPWQISGLKNLDSCQKKN